MEFFGTTKTVRKITPTAEELTLQKNVACDVCSKVFGNRSCLRLHMANAHKIAALTRSNTTQPDDAVVSQYFCPVDGCKYSSARGTQCFSTIAGVRQHYQKVHCEKCFACDLCGKFRATTERDLRFHAKSCAKTTKKLTRNDILNCHSYALCAVRPASPPTKHREAVAAAEHCSRNEQIEKLFDGPPPPVPEATTDSEPSQSATFLILHVTPILLNVETSRNRPPKPISTAPLKTQAGEVQTATRSVCSIGTQVDFTSERKGTQMKQKRRTTSAATRTSRAVQSEVSVKTEAITAAYSTQPQSDDQYNFDFADHNQCNFQVDLRAASAAQPQSNNVSATAEVAVMTTPATALLDRDIYDTFDDNFAPYDLDAISHSQTQTDFQYLSSITFEEILSTFSNNETQTIDDPLLADLNDMHTQTSLIDFIDLGFTNVQTQT